MARISRFIEELGSNNQVKRNRRCVEKTFALKAENLNKVFQTQQIVAIKNERFYFVTRCKDWRSGIRSLDSHFCLDVDLKVIATEPYKKLAFVINKKISLKMSFELFGLFNAQ